MGAHGLSGYFEYVKDKTYIDSYPESIMSLEELKGATILEIGPGTLNDMIFLIKKGLIIPDSVLFSEPSIPAFCSALDKIEEITGEHYAFMNRHRLSYRGMPNLEFPSGIADFVYANNVFHSFGYRSLEDGLDLRLIEEGKNCDDRRIKDLLKPAKDKVREAVCESYRILKPGGILFGRNLLDKVNLEALSTLEGKRGRTEDEDFAVWTAYAVLSGELIGLSEQEFIMWAREIGFSKAHTQAEPLDSIKPRRNFYFRLEK